MLVRATILPASTTRQAEVVVTVLGMHSRKLSQSACSSMAGSPYSRLSMLASSLTLCSSIPECRCSCQYPSLHSSSRPSHGSCVICQSGMQKRLAFSERVSRCRDSLTPRSPRPNRLFLQIVRPVHPVDGHAGSLESHQAIANMPNMDQLLLKVDEYAAIAGDGV